MPFSGSLDKKMSYHRNVEGTVSFIGGVTYPSAIQQAVNGMLSFTGSLTKRFSAHRSVDGILNLSGDLTTAVSKINVSGILQFFTGVLSMKKNGVPIGAMSTILEIGKSGVRFATGILRIG